MTYPKPGPVLLVDDDRDLLEGLSLSLRQTGYEVLAAPDALAARKIVLDRRDIALAVVDVNLPDANGYDLCQELRVAAERVDLPVLMISVQSELKDILRGIAAGARDCLAKPFGRREFLTAVVRTMAA